jgi:hypothetical protein
MIFLLQTDYIFSLYIPLEFLGNDFAEKLIKVGEVAQGVIFSVMNDAALASARIC